MELTLNFQKIPDSSQDYQNRAKNLLYKKIQFNFLDQFSTEYH